MSSNIGLKNSYQPESCTLFCNSKPFLSVRKVWIDRFNVTKVHPEYQIRNLSNQKVAVARMNWLGTTITVSHYQNRENVFFTYKRPLLNRLFSNTPSWNLEFENLNAMKRIVSGCIFATLPQAIEELQ